jgi:hypothetical protein
VQVFGGGTNQSVSYSNGSTMTTVSKTFYLRVDTDEDFTIGAIKVVSGDGSCSTKPIAIKVTAGAGGNNTQIPPGNTGNRVQAPRNNNAAEGQVGGQVGDDIFITLEADDQEVWLGQQVILRFKYFPAHSALEQSPVHAAPHRGVLA